MTTTLQVHPLSALELKGYIYECRENTKAELDWVENVVFPVIELYPDMLPYYTFWVAYQELPGRIIGEFLFKGVAENGEIEIGYHTTPEFRNKGYMTQIVRTMTERARDLAIKRLCAYVETWNLASMRVLLKSGFKREKNKNVATGSYPGKNANDEDVEMYKFVYDP